MPVYTVHAPLANTMDFRATDRFAFVRDGFHVWAAVLGVVWLAWHRLWLALVGWIVLMVWALLPGEPDPRWCVLAASTQYGFRFHG